LDFVKPHLPFTAPTKYWDMHDPETLPMPEIQTDPEEAPAYARKGWGEIAAYTPIERGFHPIGPELAGLPEPDLPQPLDGLSLVPVLQDPSTRIRDHVVHAYPRNPRIGRAIRTERYRLVEWNVPGDSPDSADIELCDYQEDPLESKNLAGARSELVKELLSTLNQYPMKE
jgi:hypothetical protein